MLLVQILADPDRNASVLSVPTTDALMSAASATPQAISAVLNPTTISNSIPTIVSTLVAPKASASTPAAADKVFRFVQDTAKERKDEKKDQVSPSTTKQEDDEDSEGSFTTITEIVESTRKMPKTTKKLSMTTKMLLSRMPK